MGDFSLPPAAGAAVEAAASFVVVFAAGFSFGASGFSSGASGLDRVEARAFFSCSSRCCGAESCGASAFLGGTRVPCVGGGEGEWLGEVGPLPGFLVRRELKKLARTPSAGGGVLVDPLASPSNTLCVVAGEPLFCFSTKTACILVKNNWSSSPFITRFCLMSGKGAICSANGFS